VTGENPAAIPAPWVLVDDLTVDQASDLLDRLASWLQAGDPAAAAACARALSLAETDDPISLASWADAVAARLRRRIDQSTI
jgi:hypothetical protein